MTGERCLLQVELPTPRPGHSIRSAGVGGTSFLGRTDMRFSRGRWIILVGALSVLGSSLASAQFHTVSFDDPTAVPSGHLPDDGGIIEPTSHNFQEDGVRVEAFWAPSTHVGFTQGHFHHLENGFESLHGFGDADAEGWYDVQGVYLKMADGGLFTLVSVDYRLRVDLQVTDILTTTGLDPTRPFGGQFVHQPVTRFSTFKTFEFAGFENVSEVFIASVLATANEEQIQFDNIVVWTAPPGSGGCCPAMGTACNLRTQNDCLADGGLYLGDDVFCTSEGYCPTRVGACCTPDASACVVETPEGCAVSSGVFADLGTDCGTGGVCPLRTGKCCVENGAECLQVLDDACTGPDTYFHGTGTQCVEGQACFVPCDGNGECDDLDACTIDSCDSSLGCRFEPLCGVGLACTAGECTCFEPRDDFDGNGNRDHRDFAVLLPCLVGPGQNGAATCGCQDLNDDSYIDLFDVAEFLVAPRIP